MESASVPVDTCRVPQHNKAHTSVGPCAHVKAWDKGKGSLFAPPPPSASPSSPPGQGQPLPQCAQCQTLGDRLHWMVGRPSPVVLCWTHAVPLLRKGTDKFALSVRTGALYCAQCADYVYDIAPELNAGPADTPLLTQGASLALESEHMLGLRGLANLGNTCYINAVVQVILHLAPVRAYFQRDFHSLSACPHSRSNKPCSVCELEKVFVALFDGSRAIFPPSSLMYQVWKRKSGLSGKEQRDAQEFLMALFDLLHGDTEALRRAQPALPAPDSPCECLVHSVFQGTLRSQVTCEQCGATSITEEPFLDLGLDVPKKPTVPPQHMTALEESIELLQYTVEASLARFCRSERLDQSFKCKSCQTNGSSSRQFTLHSLPNVLVVHLKRFETNRNGGRKKIGTVMDFPAEIDLRPYTRPIPVASPQTEDAMEIDEPTAPLLYSLRGVVNHSGAIDQGHYTAFIHPDHSDDAWFKCDDHKIFHATRSEVFSSQAYLLFFQRSNAF